MRRLLIVFSMSAASVLAQQVHAPPTKPAGPAASDVTPVQKPSPLTGVEKRLIEATKQGDLDTVREIANRAEDLQENIRFSVLDRAMREILSLPRNLNEAIVERYVEIAQILVFEGANLKDATGKSLADAAQTIHPRLAEFIRAKEKVNAVLNAPRPSRPATASTASNAAKATVAAAEGTGGPGR